MDFDGDREVEKKSCASQWYLHMYLFYVMEK